MILVVLAGLWCFVAMCAGLVVGEGWLRVGGLAGLLLCAALAAVLDWRARCRPNPIVEVQPRIDSWADQLHDETFNDWPRRAA